MVNCVSRLDAAYAAAVKALQARPDPQIMCFTSSVD